MSVRRIYVHRKGSANERGECLGINEAQSRAITHYGSPCLVLAGPGSGKTTVLVKRVKYLIEKHRVPPSSILVITYTKAAALSMQRRFIREMDGKVTRQPLALFTLSFIKSIRFIFLGIVS